MWVLATVLGIFLFLVLLLSIPVDLLFYAERDVTFKSKLSVGWLFGIIRKEISRKKEKSEEEEKKEKGNRKKRIKSLVAALKTRGFLKKLARFIKDIFRLLKIRKLKLDIRVGLDDPAETGLLFAVVSPVMLCVHSCSSVDIGIQPDFSQETLNGYCQGDIRVFPIQLLGPSILFVCSPTTIRAIRAACRK